jgi:O-antigen ligase
MEILFAFLPINILSFCLIAIIGILGLIFLFQIKNTQWVIYFLLIWFPFESLVLRYTPIDYYAYVKYFPEVLLYSLAIAAWVYFMSKSHSIIPKNSLTKWFVAYLVVAIISLAINRYSPVIWILGLRQLFRFALVFFIVLFCQYDRQTLYRFVWIGGGMILIQAILGVVQFLAGGRLDPYLFSTAVIQIGNTALLGGAEQFWTPGTRVFATMGRYNTLASFLALGSALFFPVIYTLKEKKHKLWAMGIAVLLGTTLLLTFSRAGWVAAFAAIFFIGWRVIKDKRILIVASTFTLVIVGYISVFSIIHGNVSQIVDQPKQSIAERILEAVSIRSFRESYEGYGRIFFIVNTPRMVVASAPLFGVGPGNYGGGVAASLLNTEAYDRIGIPFGIQNVYGQIDNSWLSIWGEVGTLGLLSWIGLFVAIYSGALLVTKKSHDTFEVAWARGVMGAVIAISVLSFFSPYFELRALMFYFWLAVGGVFLFLQKNKYKGNLLRK